jgi:hypothetical protein
LGWFLKCPSSPPFWSISKQPSLFQHKSPPTPIDITLRSGFNALIFSAGSSLINTQLTIAVCTTLPLVKPWNALFHYTFVAFHGRNNIRETSNKHLHNQSEYG